MSADLADIAARLAARAEPGEHIEVAVGRGVSTTVKAYGGQVESFTSAESFGVGVRVLVERDGGMAQGFAHAGTFDPEVLDETLRDARDNAGFAEPDPWQALAEPDGVAAVHQELWDERLAAFPTERKVELALELERATKAWSPKVKGVRVASYGDSAGEFALASTSGIRSAGRATSAWLSVSCMAGDESETHMGYGVDVCREPGGLDLAAVATEAADQAVRLIGAQQVPSQRLTLVLEPKLAATVLAIIGSMLCGDAVVKGRTPFADRLGQSIASPLLTLVDDPTDARSMGADTFDGEGLACRRNVLIDGGELRGFLHNSYTARRAGARSTASAVRGSRSLPGVGPQALAVAPGERTYEELLASVDNGSLVQSMSGLHSGVNTTSGDFSVGAEGLMIRNGALAEPVREVTIASTLPRLLLDLVAVGSEIEWLPGGSGSAALVFGEVALSGS
ncbi:MAG: TldD/PmbA family protein [Acidimicrobiales bacterium]